MTLTNKTRHIKWQETCKCICRLDKNFCHSKQRWSKDKCRCEFKELIDKGVCDKGSIFNPSNYECEYDKSCDIDPLVEKCTEIINETKLLMKMKMKIKIKIDVILI